MSRRPRLRHVWYVILIHDGGRALTSLIHLNFRALLLAELSLRDFLYGARVHCGETLVGLVDILLIVHWRRSHELTLVLQEPLRKILVVVARIFIVRVVDDAILYELSECLVRVVIIVIVVGGRCGKKKGENKSVEMDT